LLSIDLACSGVPSELGRDAALCISDEFKLRPWHEHVLCSWNGSSLLLHLENGFDNDGLASRNEFSAAISACVADGFDGDIKIEKVSLI